MNMIWKPVVGYETTHEVSDTGAVRKINGNELKQHITSGYKRVYLGGRQRCHLVHRLVAMAFVDNPEKKPAVNHRDLNKGNNELSNLEWVTIKENNDHAFSNGAGGHFFRRPGAKILIQQAIHKKNNAKFQRIAERLDAIDIDFYVIDSIKQLKRKHISALRSGSLRQMARIRYISGTFLHLVSGAHVR